MKRTPAYSLGRAQQLARAGCYAETKRSTAWLRNHGYAPRIAKRIFLALSENDYQQTLAPKRDGGREADVYKIRYADAEISGVFYVKFVVEEDGTVVVLMSCKEWGYSW